MRCLVFDVAVMWVVGVALVCDATAAAEDADVAIVAKGGGVASLLLDDDTDAHPPYSWSRSGPALELRVEGEARVSVPGNASAPVAVQGDMTSSADFVDGDGNTMAALKREVAELRAEMHSMLRLLLELSTGGGSPEASAINPHVVYPAMEWPVGGAGSHFGASIAVLGDLNGDGTPDLAVGAPKYNSNTGAVVIVFTTPNGTYGYSTVLDLSQEAVPPGHNGLFGQSVALLSSGPYNGGVAAIAVGAPGTADPVTTGSVFIVPLTAEGGVVAGNTTVWQTFTAIGGDAVDVSDRLGWAVEALGDVNGDESPDVAVSAVYDDDRGLNSGAVYIVFLNAAGGAVDARKFTTAGVASGAWPDLQFGHSLVALGDLDGNGVTDLAVGSLTDDHCPGASNGRGSFRVLRLTADGSVVGDPTTTCNLPEYHLQDHDMFGHSMASAGDLNGDGVGDLVVGAPGADIIDATDAGGADNDAGGADNDAGEADNDAGGADNAAGEVYIVFMSADGTAKSSRKINRAQGGVPVTVADQLSSHSQYPFGTSMAVAFASDSTPLLYAGIAGVGLVYPLVLSEAFGAVARLHHDAAQHE